MTDKWIIDWLNKWIKELTVKRFVYIENDEQDAVEILVSSWWFDDEKWCNRRSTS